MRNDTCTKVTDLGFFGFTSLLTMIDTVIEAKSYFESDGMNYVKIMSMFCNMNSLFTASIYFNNNFNACDFGNRYDFFNNYYSPHFTKEYLLLLIVNKILMLMSDQNDVLTILYASLACMMNVAVSFLSKRDIEQVMRDRVELRDENRVEVVL